jgi:hypothetical protein
MKVSALAIGAAIAVSFALPTGSAPATVQADVEQELLAELESCWDAWMDGVRQNDAEVFFDGCNLDQDALFWWSQDGAPQTFDQVRRIWDTISETDERWVGIRPVGVRVFGDVAIINLYGYWQAATPEGSVVTEFKRTEVFQRRADGWTFIGGHGTPASPQDAAPYQ